MWGPAVSITFLQCPTLSRILFTRLKVLLGKIFWVDELTEFFNSWRIDVVDELTQLTNWRLTNRRLTNWRLTKRRSVLGFLVWVVQTCDNSMYEPDLPRLGWHINAGCKQKNYKRQYNAVKNRIRTLWPWLFNLQFLQLVWFCKKVCRVSF